MTDRPIIFSAPMVRALLDGRKTQTRRLIKPDLVDGARFSGLERDGSWLFTRGCTYGKIKPPYEVGDRLYVREACAIVPSSAYRHSEGVQQIVNSNDPDEAAIYAFGWERSKPRWRPSIHMPRWASRLTLFVEDVRVQRLNEISEADAIAEGLVPAHEGYALTSAGECWGPTAARAFRLLWESLHGEGSWDANPWIVAVTFRIVQANIDTLDHEGF